MQHVIVLTRPKAKNDDLAFSLQSAIAKEHFSSDVQVVSLPALTIRPYAWQELSIAAQNDFQSLSQFDAVFCVSPIAIEQFFTLVEQQSLILPENMLFLCVGTGSQSQLEQRGIAQSRIVVAQQGNDSEALLAALSEQLLALKKLLIIRADTGRDWFKEQLQAQGIAVYTHAIYRRESVVLNAEQKHFFTYLNANTTFQWLFTSSESVQALIPSLYNLGIFNNLFCDEQSQGRAERIGHQFWVIHPRIGQTIVHVFEKLFSKNTEKMHLTISMVGAENQQIQEAMLKHIHNMG